MNLKEAKEYREKREAEERAKKAAIPFVPQKIDMGRCRLCGRDRNTPFGCSC